MVVGGVSGVVVGGVSGVVVGGVSGVVVGLPGLVFGSSGLVGLPGLVGLSGLDVGPPGFEGGSPGGVGASSPQEVSIIDPHRAKIMSIERLIFIALKWGSPPVLSEFYT